MNKKDMEDIRYYMFTFHSGRISYQCIANGIIWHLERTHWRPRCYATDHNRRSLARTAKRLDRLTVEIRGLRQHDWIMV